MRMFHTRLYIALSLQLSETVVPDGDRSLAFRGECRLGSQTSSFRNPGRLVNSRPHSSSPGYPQNTRDLARRGRPVGFRPSDGEFHRSTLVRSSADRALLLSADSESLRPGLESYAEAGPRV